MEHWFKTSTAANTGLLVNQLQVGASVGIGTSIGTAAAGKVSLIKKNEAGTLVVSSATFNDGAWHHVVGISSGAAGTLYIDGLLVSTANWAGGANVTYGTTQPVYIGRNFGASYYAGDLDELRISNAVRTWSWIKTEYNNQSNPDTFYTIGAEEVVQFPAYLQFE